MTTLFKLLGLIIMLPMFILGVVWSLIDCGFCAGCQWFDKESNTGD